MSSRSDGSPTDDSNNDPAAEGAGRHPADAGNDVNPRAGGGPIIGEAASVPAADTALSSDGPLADPHDEADRVWLRDVYAGDRVRQLSVRSIVAGMVIGAVMSISNLYVGLKTGWGLTVTITACIVAYAVFRALESVVPRFRRDPFTILENYTMSSAASAAGYMASAGLVSAVPALYLVTGRELVWWEMMSWLAAISVLGVFMAVPLKRQLINIEQLPFPSGIATAETLRSMHTVGAMAVAKARSLLAAGVFGALVAIDRDALPPLAEALEKRPGNQRFSELLSGFAMPEQFPLFPHEIARGWVKQLSIGVEGSVFMLAAGAIMGIRVGLSLLGGAIVFFGILGPVLIEQGWTEPGFTGIVRWTLWPATALMVASGLLSFALRWRTVVRAFRGLAAIVGAAGGERNDPLAAVEVPGSWFAVGTLTAGTAAVVLGHYLFGVVWWTGILAVILTFVLSIVAARATGETDVTPIGAMGKITQLFFGVIAPSNPTANLMAASITAGAASHSADLLTDLKTGYLLGGNARKQTISQLFGVLAGTLVCVPVYSIVVDPAKLGSPELPAPAAIVWASVAKIFSEGLDKLPPHVLTAMLVGAAVGVVLTLLETFLPPRYRKWVPSPTGLGIAGVVPAFNSIAMFVGALAAWCLSKASPKTDETYTVSVSSGLIAGESLMGVAIKLCLEGPGLLAKIFHFGSGG